MSENIEVKFCYVKCPLHRYTFRIKPIKDFVEKESSGLVLNLFAGYTKLKLNEIRNDLDVEALADYHLDAVEFVNSWKGKKFDTVILDPPILTEKVWKCMAVGKLVDFVS